MPSTDAIAVFAECCARPSIFSVIMAVSSCQVVLFWLFVSLRYNSLLLNKILTVLRWKGCYAAKDTHFSAIN